MQIEVNFSIAKPQINRRYRLINFAKLSFIISIYILIVIYTMNPVIRYRTAALIGDNKAIFALGEYYEKQQSNTNLETSLFWYHKAAEDGNTDAQMKMGYAYMVGRGVRQDYQKAFKWYGLAAEQGIADAQFALGLLYHNERVAFSNVNMAEKWYRLADAQGSTNASGSLGWLLIETERWDEAKLFTQKAHDADPQNWAWITNLGNLALLNGKKAEAKAFYLKALPLISSKEEFQNGPLADMDLFIERNWQPDLCREMKQLMLNEWQQRKK
jgi:TPR repeat protein